LEAQQKKNALDKGITEQRDGEGKKKEEEKFHRISH
jgi:hypothetical protein